VHLPSPEDDLEDIAVRVARKLGTDELDRRVTARVVKSLRKDDWKSLGNQVLKSLNIFYHGRQVAYILLGLWRFWLLFIPIILFALLTVWGLGAWVARDRAVNLFNETVTNQIQLQFKDPRISNIVVSVASIEATNVLLGQIQPTITDFQRTVSYSFVQLQTNIDARIQEVDWRLKESQRIETNLQAVITDARQALHRLDEDSEFVTTATMADHDDRSAYEKLRNWANDRSFRRHEFAARVASRIQTGYYKDERPWLAIDWPASSTNRFAWNMEQVSAAWTLMNENAANDFVRFVWGHTNLSREQRISFLRSVYLKDSHNSLQAANTAASLAAGDLGVPYNPAFIYGGLEERWLEFTATNHLFDIPTNCPTNMVYDVIPPASTNRLMILRDWGNANLVLFKLKYAPVSSSVTGLWWKAGASVDHCSVWSNHYLNVVWGAFAGWNSNSTKCEFKYERDFSKTTVRTISVTTNALILDDSVRIPIP
jgi:hypothetical protein